MKNFKIIKIFNKINNLWKLKRLPNNYNNKLFQIRIYKTKVLISQC